MNASKIVLWAAVALIVSFLVLASLGFKLNKDSGGGNGDYSSLPEKCRPPAGQDITAWKQHLSHHSETQDCLEYFK